MIHVCSERYGNKKYELVTGWQTSRYVLRSWRFTTLTYVKSTVLSLIPKQPLNFTQNLSKLITFELTWLVCPECQMTVFQRSYWLRYHRWLFFGVPIGWDITGDCFLVILLAEISQVTVFQRSYWLRYQSWLHWLVLICWFNC